jgi:carboxyl-terminal processing protease
MRRRRPLVPILLVLLPVFLVAGVWLGGHPDKLPGFARDAFVDDQQAQVYQEAVDLIQDDYYRPVDRKQLLDKSLGAAVKSLDDQFSNYFSPKDYTDFQEATSGQFEGVGMTVEEAKRGLRVMTVYAGSPASRGGLKSGDIITKVNGRSIAGSSSEASTARIKGPAGTSVTLTVDGGSREREVTLKRAQVDIPVVESSMERDGAKKIGHVRRAGFTSGAHGEVKQAVDKLLHQGADGIVLDLRDNGGGLLNEAVLVSSIFVPNGRIVSTKGRSRPEQVYDATGGAIPSSVPVAVLVNRQSASASEIVTGAL